MPVGLLITVLLIGACVLLQVRAIRRSPLLRIASFWTSMLVNEQPHWFALLLVAVTGLTISQGGIDSTAGYILVAFAALVLAGLFYLLQRAFPFGSSASLPATLLAPAAFGRGKVERIDNISYGPAGKRNLLDVYRPVSGEVTGPTLIYLHGGGFKSGDKRREAKAMKYGLAAKGWLCISANYRLSPDSQFPDYVIDLKKVIIWAREVGIHFGVDPDRIILAGGSAGGHVAATAALTAGEPLLQPGFESSDTTVAGAVGIYGYYGGLEYGAMRPMGPLPSSPRSHVSAGAPPFLVIHGDHDTVVPVSNARAFVSDLRKAGGEVEYIELPGAQHTFDLLRSVRSENAIAAIEDFAANISPSEIQGGTSGAELLDEAGSA